jgi:hypothetical protein
MIMEMQPTRYPIGIQTFSEIRNKGYLYVDKTEYVYNLSHGVSKYYFLSRPRRFGKSLLTSTLVSYFSGKRELFEGLKIMEMEKEWVEYPVLHFDMSLAKHVDKERLHNHLSYQLSRYEKQYDLEPQVQDENIRLTALIEKAYQQTARQVVILIDEYDAPLLDVMHEERDLPKLRDVMRNFYSPLKACDPYLRFVFLTGITKFSQLSIFSELNNITNISMLPEYSAICGITQDEMVSQMSVGINEFSKALKVSEEEILNKLKINYDGYHFCWPSEDIFNPFSLLNSFAYKRFDSYWFGSGTPTYLIEMLRKFDVSPDRIGNLSAQSSDFDAPTERMLSAVPLLYQSGYITIKGYDDITELYHLDIPNKEVRVGLMKSLLPNYTIGTNQSGVTTVALMYRAIYNGNMDEALTLLQTFLSTVPYADNTNYEGHYQQLFYIIFSLFGMYVEVEVRTPRGRVDLVMKTATTLYLVELKLDSSADAAINQIELKNYPEKFSMCGLPIVKVGINFDKETHTLGEWKVVK